MTGPFEAPPPRVDDIDETLALPDEDEPMHDDQAALYDAAIRDLQAQETHCTEALAAKLAEITDRESWSTREIAKWCAKEQLGNLNSHARVVQLLGYHRLVTELRQRELVPAGITLPEWSLRPLVVLLNKGCLVTVAASS